MNTSKLNLMLNVLKFVLVGVGVLVCLLVWGGPNAEADETLRNDFLESFKLSTAIGFTLTIIVAGIAIVLLFFVIQMIVNTKKTVMSIVGLIIALFVFLFIWMMGTTDTSETLMLRDPVDQGTIGTVTAGIYTVIIGLFVGVLVILLAPIMGRMRK